MEEKAEHKSGYKSIVHGQVVEEHRLAGAGCNGRPSAAGRQQEFWPGLLCGKNCCARSNLLERTSLSAVYWHKIASWRINWIGATTIVQMAPKRRKKSGQIERGMAKKPIEYSLLCALSSHLLPPPLLSTSYELMETVRYARDARWSSISTSSTYDEVSRRIAK